MIDEILQIISTLIKENKSTNLRVKIEDVEYKFSYRVDDLTGKFELTIKQRTDGDEH